MGKSRMATCPISTAGDRPIAIVGLESHRVAAGRFGAVDDLERSNQGIEAINCSRIRRPWKPQ